MYFQNGKNILINFEKSKRLIENFQFEINY